VAAAVRGRDSDGLKKRLLEEDAWQQILRTNYWRKKEDITDETATQRPKEIRTHRGKKTKTKAN